MIEIPWATPEALGKLTLTQLRCLMCESSRRSISPAELLAIAAEYESEEDSWHSS